MSDRRGDWPPAPSQSRSSPADLHPLDFFRFVASAIDAGQRTAVFGVVMIAGAFLGGWQALFLPRDQALFWVIVTGPVEIAGWAMLVALWLRERDHRYAPW